nr:transposase [Helicobacter pylori]
MKVPPQYTSKTCCHCGSINPKLKLNHRQYWCPVEQRVKSFWGRKCPCRL